MARVALANLGIAAIATPRVMPAWLRQASANLRAAAAADPDSEFGAELIEMAEIAIPAAAGMAAHLALRPVIDSLADLVRAMERRLAEPGRTA